MSPKKSQHESIRTPLSPEEPSRDYADKSPWDPSPMSWQSGDEFAYKQKVDAFINQIIDTQGPADLDHSVRQAVQLNFLGTQARLMQHNFEAYQDLQDRYDVNDPEVATLLEKAHAGTATQSELVELVRDVPLVSIELAKLTHPYGIRSEYLSPMEELVLSAIDENDGMIYGDDEQATLRLKIHHHQKYNDHFIATTKQVIGEVGDVQIAKRVASVVLVDKGRGFDADVAARMKQTHSNESDSDWHHRVFKQSGVQELIKSINPKAQPEWLLPISTVYYGYRDGRRKRPEKKKIPDQASALLFDLVRATGLIKKP